MLQVVHTIAGTRQSHGGTSRSVPALCDSLSDLGIDTHLVAGVPADDAIACNFPKDRSRVATVRESAWGRQIGVPSGFKRHLRDLCGGRPERCVVHDHGLWLATNHAVAIESSRLGAVRVVSPRGMLSPWSLNRRRVLKRVTWKLYQRRDLESVTAFHATSEAEANDIRALGLKQPIAIIPNGVAFPTELPTRPATPKKRILFLSRIHPVKGLVNLVNAFQRANLPEPWSLALVGHDDGGHKAEIQRLVDQLGLGSRVTIAGPVDDQEKWQLFSDAELFVLPSHTENFGISIAEAMATELPVITTTGTPWAVLREQKMGWWVEPNVDSLAQAISEACALDTSRRHEMGCRSSQYVHDNFSWARIGTQFIEFYNWLLEETECVPDFVSQSASNSQL